MASIWKHPKSKFWFACIRLPDGRRTKRSTKETDRKKAQGLAEKWEQVSRRVISATQARKVISDIYKVSTGEELSHFTPRTHCEKWLSAKKPEIDSSTAEKYTATVTEFLSFLAEKSDKDLLQLTTEDIQRFRDSMAQKSSPKTANNKLVIISQAITSAWKDGNLPEDIAGRVRKLKLQGRQQKRLPFTFDQVRKIYAKSSGEWLGIILLGAYTGQRLGDLATLQWKNFDERSMTLNIVSQKQNRTTRVPLTGPLATWVKSSRKNKAGNDHVFPESTATIAKNKGKVSALSKQFLNILASAGIAEKREWKSQGKGRTARRVISPLSFHSFRHTLTTELKELGGSAAVVQDIIGHDSTAVSEQYTHVNDDVKRECLEKLPDFTQELNLRQKPQKNRE